LAYVIDPDVLREVARLEPGLPNEQPFRTIARALAEHYPGRITEEQEWVFSNAGGVMGQFTILYASLTEYVIFFGSPIGSAGHTGRYNFVKDWAFVLDGEIRYFEQGQIVRDVCRAGDETILEPGIAKGFNIVDHAWRTRCSSPTIFGPSSGPSGSTASTSAGAGSPDRRSRPDDLSIVVRALWLAGPAGRDQRLRPGHLCLRREPQLLRLLRPPA